MNKNILKVLMLVLSIFLNSSFAMADTIYLKSGNEIEGKIVEKTDKYVKVNFQGIDLIYYTQEIARIIQEGVQVSLPNAENPDAQGVADIIGAGNVCSDKGDYDKAIEYYKKAYGLDKNDPSVLLNLGRAYFNKRDYDTAIIYFNEAVKLNPNDGHGYHGLARCYKEKGDIENAVINFKEYLRLDPNGEFADLVKRYLKGAGEL